MKGLQTISAVTLATADMDRAVAFYEALGLSCDKGGRGTDFTTFRVGKLALNLIAETRGPIRWWGRVIFHVADVDAVYRDVRAAGLAPDFAPSDAPWGERYFHITDPDGHELSFATPLPSAGG
ncbi:MAG: VOC family protein [Alphaproteobacteria bacterium]|nr:VOC family protein [Alphaproteobacteria bacterium]